MNKNTKVLVALAVFMVMLGVFIYGNVTGVTGLVAISVFYYWAVSIIGLFGFSEKVAVNILENDPKFEITFDPYFDIAMDLVVLTVLVYFGYTILPIFWLLHIFAINELRKNINALKQ